MTLRDRFVNRVTQKCLFSYSGRMRWDSLFDDLEAQLAEQSRAQLREEIAENIRVERATAELLPTLMRFYGHELSLRLAGGSELRAKLGPCATDYICLETEQAQWVIRSGAIESFALPPRRAPAVERRAPGRSVKFSSVLRGLLRDRARCHVFGRAGSSMAEGTLTQVAKDFLIILVHPRDEFARAQQASTQLLIPLDAIGWVEAITLS
ncbi:MULTISPECIES: hypothetical protein [unclassified Arthrobacter]|uniref:hypothetical protein n=1 Tax=Micrococcaceae TaxID=1268 RepID=UPI00105C4CC4|nr:MULTISPECIES: hypothetical protein [unclassified Arthrobacter]